MCAPGASTSGFAKPSWVVPRLDQEASASSSIVLGALVVDAADRDHVRVVGRRVVDGVGGGALVAGGDDDDDAAVPGRLDRRVERVGLVGLGDRRAQRQVDDADVVVGLVVDDELQAVDHVEDAGVAVRRRRP